MTHTEGEAKLLSIQSLARGSSDETSTDKIAPPRHLGKARWRPIQWLGGQETMTRERDKQLLSIANASGFPFQLSVVRRVQTILAKRGWKVLVTEHPWTDPDTGASGFIDLVVERDSIRLVVECKRAQQGQWVFLHDKGDTPSKEGVRLFATLNSASGKKEAEWAGCLVDPASVEAGFCAVRGSGEGDRPLLERLAGVTCKATETFGTQELTVEDFDVRTVYIPVIITNAELVTCSVDPDEIDVSTGLLTEGGVDFETVSLVRFRKPLGLHRNLSGFTDVGAVNRDAERTVLIVQASDLLRSLGGLSIKGFVPDTPRTRSL